MLLRRAPILERLRHVSGLEVRGAELEACQGKGRIELHGALQVLDGLPIEEPEQRVAAPSVFAVRFEIAARQLRDGSECSSLHGVARHLIEHGRRNLVHQGEHVRAAGVGTRGNLAGARVGERGRDGQVVRCAVHGPGEHVARACPLRDPRLEPRGYDDRVFHPFLSQQIEQPLPTHDPEIFDLGE